MSTGNEYRLFERS